MMAMDNQAPAQSCELLFIDDENMWDHTATTATTTTIAPPTTAASPCLWGGNGEH
ncbi:hypothetical protein L208DRAFT_1398503 [Tricholoma matsutake]|nr:hypothetical protein L208DRAFT_1398503 [Tricholoma matsutake 945]